jgi:hypothetical protein
LRWGTWGHWGTVTLSRKKIKELDIVLWVFIVPHLLFREWGMWGTIGGFAATGETSIMIIIRIKNAHCANRVKDTGGYMDEDIESYIKNALKQQDVVADKKFEKLRFQLEAAEDYEKEMALSHREGFKNALIQCLSENKDERSSNKKSFPVWAPPVLLRRLSFFTDDYVDENYVFILKKLCTDKGMENIWGWLNKNFIPSANVQSSATLAYLFSQEVSKAYWGWKGWGALTKNQGDKKIKLILKLLSGLSKELRNFPVSENIMSELTGDEMASLQVGFVRHTLQGIDSEIPSYFGRMVEDAAYDSPVELGDLYLKREIPSLCDVLERVELKLSSSTFESRTTSNSDTGQLRFFIRSLAGFMVANYGSRKDAQLAEIGNVFFDRTDLDKKKVEDLFREPTKKMKKQPAKTLKNSK